jgi:hypothetical protein
MRCCNKSTIARHTFIGERRMEWIFPFLRLGGRSTCSIEVVTRLKITRVISITQPLHHQLYCKHRVPEHGFRVLSTSYYFTSVKTSCASFSFWLLSWLSLPYVNDVNLFVRSSPITDQTKSTSNTHINNTEKGIMKRRQKIIFRTASVNLAKKKMVRENKRIAFGKTREHRRQWQQFSEELNLEG